MRARNQSNRGPTVFSFEGEENEKEITKKLTIKKQNRQGKNITKSKTHTPWSEDTQLPSLSGRLSLFSVAD